MIRYKYIIIYLCTVDRLKIVPDTENQITRKYFRKPHLEHNAG